MARGPIITADPRDQERARAGLRFLLTRFTQAELAEALGISAPYISLMVNGRKPVPDRICESMRWLAGDDNKTNRRKAPARTNIKRGDREKAST